jgi:hypothetical protein
LFLLHRTYVDNTTTRANTQEDLIRISRGLEEIVANGGFTFKETLITGDKMEKSGEPRKVFGSFWNTEQDQLQVDVKVNFSSKKRGACLGPIIDLLWRVVSMILWAYCAQWNRSGISAGGS